MTTKNINVLPPLKKKTKTINKVAFLHVEQCSNECKTNNNNNDNNNNSPLPVKKKQSEVDVKMKITTDNRTVDHHRLLRRSHLYDTGEQNPIPKRDKELTRDLPKNFDEEISEAFDGRYTHTKKKNEIIVP